MSTTTTANEHLADARWHLTRAADALAAAARDKPLFGPELDQARQQLQQVAAGLPKLEQRP